MASIGCTGLRNLTPDLWRPVDNVLAVLAAEVYVTAAAVGFDAFAGRRLVGLHPHARHMVIVPGSQLAVEHWWLRAPYDTQVIVERMPIGSTFRDRNQALVDRVNLLHAFPEFAEHDPRSRRSGTWQVIRMARRADKGVVVHVLRPEPPHPELPHPEPPRP